jgi:hypothetical protein
LARGHQLRTVPSVRRPVREVRRPVREVRTAASCARIELVDLGWIWTGNLRPLTAELALLTGYQFSDSDWIAIEYAGFSKPTARLASGLNTRLAASW